MIQKNICDQIKRLMVKRGIKTAELSRLANLNASTVYAFMNGGNKISLKNIEKLYEVLN